MHFQAAVDQQEQEEEDDFFPFNMDEFVTVDEVCDDAEEESAEVIERSAKRKRSQDSPQTVETSPPQKKPAAASQKFQKATTPASKGKAAKKTPPKASTRRTRSSAATGLKEEEMNNAPETLAQPESMKPKGGDEAEEPKENLLKTDTPVAVGAEDQQGAVEDTKVAEVAAGTAANSEFSEESQTQEVKNELKTEESFLAQPVAVSEAGPVTTESVKTESSTTPLSGEAEDAGKATVAVKVEESADAELADKETDSQKSNNDHSTEASKRAKKLVVSAEVCPSQNVLVMLDEVSEGEEDFPDDDEAEEEERLKRQAGEDPEALMTVDEVGEDEAEIPEQLGDLHALVTLDEIVADEEEEDDGESEQPVPCLEMAPDNQEDESGDAFNPEVSNLLTMTDESSTE